MSERAEIVAENAVHPVAPKRPWHAPVIQETDYSSTEVGPLPGGTYDGLGFYSVIP